jgi:L-threonylcarbamoyladenylate synthase
LNKRQEKSDHLFKIRQINPENPEPDLIKEAAGVIEQGGIVAFPAKNLYGLGADAFNLEAVDKIFRIKQRSYQKPLLVLIKHKDELERLVRAVPPAANRIIDRFWPGRVTIVFEVKAGLPIKLTAKTGRIGVRLPAQPVAAALTNAVKNPITGTSANISGNIGCSNVADLDPIIIDKLDLILDIGSLPEGVGSTVVDVTTGKVKILREGTVPAKDVFNALTAI